MTEVEERTRRLAEAHEADGVPDGDTEGGQRAGSPAGGLGAHGERDGEGGAVSGAG